MPRVGRRERRPGSQGGRSRLRDAAAPPRGPAGPPRPGFTGNFLGKLSSCGRMTQACAQHSQAGARRPLLYLPGGLGGSAVWVRPLSSLLESFPQGLSCLGGGGCCGRERPSGCPAGWVPSCPAPLPSLTAVLGLPLPR